MIIGISLLNLTKKSVQFKNKACTNSKLKFIYTLIFN
jgi:hypothetical protein